MPEINMTKPVRVQAKELRLHIKVRDAFDATLHDQHGEELVSYEGYVPDFMPGEHFGDYLILEIDLDSGQIMNWKIPKAAQIEEFIAKAQIRE